MRVTFYLVYIVFAAGLCVHVFRVNEINYMHILELDYRKKVSQYQLWTSAAILMFIWTTAFTYDFLKVFFFDLGDRNDWSCLVLVILMLVICIQPCFNYFHRITRWELLKSLGQVVIAPFGTVRFRDYYLADCITSLTTPLADIGYICAYFNQGKWELLETQLDETKSLKIYLQIAYFLPIWWRFWQSIKKWKKGNKPQKKIALKYFAKFGPPIILLAGGKKKFGYAAFWPYFGAQMV